MCAKIYTHMHNCLWKINKFLTIKNKMGLTCSHQFCFANECPGLSFQKSVTLLKVFKIRDIWQIKMIVLTKKMVWNIQCQWCKAQHITTCSEQSGFSASKWLSYWTLTLKEPVYSLVKLAVHLMLPFLITTVSSTTQFGKTTTLQLSAPQGPNKWIITWEVLGSLCMIVSYY